MERLKSLGLIDFSTIELDNVQIALVDDRILVAQTKNETMAIPTSELDAPRREFLTFDLVEIFECENQEKVTATIQDRTGEQIGDFKFLCHSLRVSPNLINYGYSVLIQAEGEAISVELNDNEFPPIVDSDAPTH